MIKTPRSPAQLNKKLIKAGIIGGLELKRFYPDLPASEAGMTKAMLWCATEMNTREDIDKLIKTLSKE